MLMGSSCDARSLVPLQHGGDLSRARQLFPNAPEPFIDLSTGINPDPYPLPSLPDALFARLPDATALRRLAEVAARAYRAPSAEHVVCAPGTQMLLPPVARLVPPGHAAILSPTYAEHARAAALAGHRATEVTAFDQLQNARLAVVVNPNNPDGRILAKSTLLDLADALTANEGILVVDEAFADVVPPEVSLADAARANVVVLRSFGKFFGLAGLRLGFALTAPELARRLQTLLGPWAVSGPALHVGAIALADESWKIATRARLAEAAQHLDALLSRAKLEIVGGTSLYRLTRAARSGALFRHLGHAGILVRRFEENPTDLRWGLPKTDDDWRRLSAALAAWHESG
jgi:cobalamin biosynthetic protein CobC